jgi:hypothetical protein
LPQAVRWKLLLTNPAEDVQLPRQPRRRFTVFDVEQATLTTAAAAGTSRSHCSANPYQPDGDILNRVSHDHQGDRIVAERQQSTGGFIQAQRLAQAAHFTAVCPEPGYKGSAYRLAPHRREFNLAPSIREAAPAYFNEKRITWHIHASHGLSSQVCCLNFLMPLATHPGALSRVMANALGIEPPEMLEIECGPNGEPWFIGFEWIGERDYLNEGGASSSRTRGANATSSDAILRFRHAGRIETLLIEWKYTETYGAPIPNKVREGAARTPNEVRADRYRKLMFAPNGPIRDDLNLKLEDFFWEPFYQLLRQQMLAFQMEKAREAETDRVRVLHVSPAENRRLHAVTSKALNRFGVDAFAVFAETLVDPAAFVGRTIEQVFGPLMAEMPEDPWAAYLAGRYPFLAPTDPADGLPRSPQS